MLDGTESCLERDTLIGVIDEYSNSCIIKYYFNQKYDLRVLLP